MAVILLRAGAKYDVLDVHGWNAQQIAELFGHVEFQELMIRQGMTIKQVSCVALLFLFIRHILNIQMVVVLQPLNLFFMFHCCV